MAVIEKRENELSLDEIVSRISGVDIIITEGYKREKKPKIEVFRKEFNQELISRQDELMAVASDIPFDLKVPCYHFDDYQGLASLIEDFIKESRKD